MVFGDSRAPGVKVEAGFKQQASARPWHRQTAESDERTFCFRFSRLGDRTFNESMRVAGGFGHLSEMIMSQGYDNDYDHGEDCW